MTIHIDKERLNIDKRQRKLWRKLLKQGFSDIAKSNLRKQLQEVVREYVEEELKGISDDRRQGAAKETS